MDPFFGNHRSWYQTLDPRYYAHSPSYTPVHRVDPWETCLPSHAPPSERRTPPAAHKVVRIPVQSVGSRKLLDPWGCALKIQKVFRGFLVRKCMRKIKDIKVKVDEIEERVSNDSVVELIQKDEKERLRMNETLMSLLIQLDCISGLDFGVRQCRKAVIRRAILLQEKIDAIVAANNNLNGNNDNNGSEIEEENKSSSSIGSGNGNGNGNGGEKCVEDDTMRIEGGNGSVVVDDGVDAIDAEVKVNCDNTPVEMENDKQSRNGNGDELLLEKMMEENEKMMSMMRRVFEKNEEQTRMLNMLTHRVESLEKAFVQQQQRKKKKNNKKNGLLQPPHPTAPRREED